MNAFNSMRFLSISSVILFCLGCTPNASSQPAESTAESTARSAVTVSSLPLSAVVDLGVVVQGESIQFNHWIKNVSNEPILADRLESSCDCLDVRLTQKEIAPGRRALARYFYDGSKEPDFVGSLRIEITIFDARGNKTGTISAPLEIVAASDLN